MHIPLPQYMSTPFLPQRPSPNLNLIPPFSLRQSPVKTTTKRSKLSKEMQSVPVSVSVFQTLSQRFHRLKYLYPARKPIAGQFLKCPRSSSPISPGAPLSKSSFPLSLSTLRRPGSPLAVMTSLRSRPSNLMLVFLRSPVIRLC